MESVSWDPNLDEAICISHGANIVREGMRLTILPPALGKIVGQIVAFNPGKAAKKS